MKSTEFRAGGMLMYTQLAALDRKGKATIDGQILDFFTVKAGDVWNPDEPKGDASKHSERTENRSLTADPVGDGKAHTYRIPVLIPLDFPEFSPKQTLAQWHKGGYPVAFLRYENGVLEFVTNYKSGLNYRKAIPFTKGKLLVVMASFIWDAGENAGTAYVSADGKVVCDLQKHSLVETGTPTVYFKNGIYRSGMDAYKGPKPAPDQTVYFGLVTRVVDTSIVRLPPAPVVNPPIATTPAPVIPPPAAPTAISLYTRIAALKVSIQSLEPDMAAKYAASVPFLGQAVEKLEKMQAQMEKVDAKAK